MSDTSNLALWTGQEVGRVLKSIIKDDGFLSKEEPPKDLMIEKIIKAKLEYALEILNIYIETKEINNYGN